MTIALLVIAGLIVIDTLGVLWALSLQGLGRRRARRHARQTEPLGRKRVGL